VVGIDNTFVGKEAGLISGSSDLVGRNTGVGARALRGANISGGDNTAVGFQALASTTGSIISCTAVGSRALQDATIARLNTAVGNSALEKNTTGNFNIAVGSSALSNVTGGNRNIGIGERTGITLTSGDDNIYIGSDSGAAAESDTIRIGAVGTQTDCFTQGIHSATVDGASDLSVLVDSTGKLGTATSSKRYKNNIIDMDTFSDDLMNLLASNVYLQT